MNFFKIFNLLTIIAVSNVNGSENNTNMSDTLHLSNSSLEVSASINNEPFSCSLSTILVNDSKNSNNQSNISIITNNSNTFHFSNSSIDATVDIEHEDPFYCDTSAIAEDKNSNVMSNSEIQEYKNILGALEG